jgi:hypothetical protein
VSDILSQYYVRDLFLFLNRMPRRKVNTVEPYYNGLMGLKVVRFNESPVYNNTSLKVQ